MGIGGIDIARAMSFSYENPADTDALAAWVPVFAGMTDDGSRTGLPVRYQAPFGFRPARSAAASASCAHGRIASDDSIAASGTDQ